MLYNMINFHINCNCVYYFYRKMNTITILIDIINNIYSPKLVNDVSKVIQIIYLSTFY